MCFFAFCLFGLACDCLPVVFAGLCVCYVFIVLVRCALLVSGVLLILLSLFVRLCVWLHAVWCLCLIVDVWLLLCIMLCVLLLCCVLSVLFDVLCVNRCLCCCVVCV